MVVMVMIGVCGGLVYLRVCGRERQTETERQRDRERDPKKDWGQTLN